MYFDYLDWYDCVLIWFVLCVFFHPKLNKMQISSRFFFAIDFPHFFPLYSEYVFCNWAGLTKPTKRSVQQQQWEKKKNNIVHIVYYV